MTEFRKVDSTTLFAGRVFTLFDETYSSPTGELFDRQIVRNNGAVAVVALHDDRTVTLIRQYRPAVGRAIVEIPAGLLDRPGEVAIDAAHRELREEVGLVAASMRHIGTCYPAPGMTDERIDIYLAEGLTSVETEADGPEEEALVIERVSVDAALAMVASGEIVDGKTQIGLLRLQQMLG